MFDEIDVEWEDGSYWAVSWFQEAGCFFAQRWFPDDDDGVEGPFIETPGPEIATVEDLATLEAVMGRPLPTQARTELQAIADAHPFTDAMRASRGEAVAFGSRRMGNAWRRSLRPATRNPSRTAGCLSGCSEGRGACPCLPARLAPPARSRHGQGPTWTIETRLEDASWNRSA